LGTEAPWAKVAQPAVSLDQALASGGGTQQCEADGDSSGATNRRADRAWRSGREWTGLAVLWSSWLRSAPGGAGPAERRDGDNCRRAVVALVKDLHMRRTLGRLPELVEPHGAALLVSNEKPERNCGKSVREPLIEEGTVRVVHHYPVVALGADGNVGKIERS